MSRSFVPNSADRSNTTKPTRKKILLSDFLSMTLVFAYNLYDINFYLNVQISCSDAEVEFQFSLLINSEMIK